MSVLALLIVIAAAWHVGMGSLSGFGAKSISAICPLGYLETALASRTLMPRLVIPFLFFIAITILVGRVFCSWICPIPLVRSWLPNSGTKARNFVSNAPSDDSSPLTVLPAEEPTECLQQQASAKKLPSSGLLILGGTLLSSAICGFPVFCLVCPIGLFFATLFAIIRLFRFNDPSLDLILFPIVIFAELVLLKKWCSKLCPLGALLILFSSLNRNLVPTVDRSVCLAESRGINCRQCRSVCSFDVDLKSENGTGNLNKCSKCRDCAENCPVQAISFPWWRNT